MEKDWKTIIGRKWFSQPGQHGISIGMTGSGKTTKLYWQVEGIRFCNKGETIAWFDTGKSSESATLMTLGPVRYIIPRGCKIDVKRKEPPEGVKTYEHEVVEFTTPAECWKLLQKGWINVISLKPYVIDPPTYAICVAELFTTLIRLAHKYQIITPLTVVIDELQVVAPAPKAGNSQKVNEAAAMIELNIEMLRSFGIRFIAATQGAEKVRRGVRTEFGWIIANRGCNFFRHDEPRLYKFNDRFHRLGDREFIVIFPERYFSDIITIDYYPKGEWIADIRYHGEFLLDKKKNKVNNDQEQPVIEPNTEKTNPKVNPRIVTLEELCKNCRYKGLTCGQRHHEIQRCMEDAGIDRVIGLKKEVLDLSKLDELAKQGFFDNNNENEDDGKAGACP